MNKKDEREEEEQDKLTVEMLHRIYANPFYAITVDKSLTIPHENMVTEDEWVKNAIIVMEQNGPELFLRNLLANLKGDYV